MINSILGSVQGKSVEKQKAIELRRQGKTYNEILKQVPVAKSTLSLWLRDVGLSKPQKQKLTARKRAAQVLGGQARKQQRVEQTTLIFQNAARDIGVLTKRERFLIGVALYWAEGAKEKVGAYGQGIDFCNTDPHMIKFFVNWLREFLGVEDSHIRYSLYIHKNHEPRLDEVKKFWRTTLQVKSLDLAYVYYKKHNPKTVRKNVSSKYYGTLRIQVRRSTTLQRRILGLIYGINGAPCPVV